jgi:hypothetical protein
VKYRTKFGKIISTPGRKTVNDGFVADDGKVFRVRDTAVFLVGSKARFDNEWTRTPNTLRWYKNHEIYLGELV